jgi:hypothetical protein
MSQLRAAHVRQPPAKSQIEVFVDVPFSLCQFSLFAGNRNLKPEQFHGLAHERGKIGRLPGRDQIGVNNHFPFLIERAGFFQFITHRTVAGGMSSLQKAGADQYLRPVQMAATGLL